MSVIRIIGDDGHVEVWLDCDGGMRCDGLVVGVGADNAAALKSAEVDLLVALDEVRTQLERLGATAPRRHVMRTELTVHRAGDIGSQQVPALEIGAMQPVPENLSLVDARALYERDGHALAEALHQHLPGGTLDQVLIGLLQRTASLLRVTAPMLQSELTHARAFVAWWRESGRDQLANHGWLNEFYDDAVALIAKAEGSLT